MDDEKELFSKCSCDCRVFVFHGRRIDTLNVGDTAHLQAIITPADATDQDVTWRMTPTARTAKLNKDGLNATLTSTKANTFTVTATLGDFQASCGVTFVEEETALEDIEATEQTTKYIQNGQLVIYHQGQKVNSVGQVIK